MRPAQWLPALVALLLLGAALAVGPPPPPTPTDLGEEAIVRGQDVALDDKSLLTALRSHATRDRSARGIKALVEQLDDDAAAFRAAAEERLIALGRPALPALRDVEENDRRRFLLWIRAREVIAAIESRAETDINGLIALRVLRRRPAGYLPALMAYLPYASDDLVSEAISFGVDDAARRDVAVVGVLAQYMDDPMPARRAVAACVVASRGLARHRRAARRLLKDEDPTVRLRAAQGLLAAKDKDAIPALIDLLTCPAVMTAWQAEELLAWIAGGDAPATTVGTGEGNRPKKARAAWLAWWKKAEGQLEIGRALAGRPRPLLYLVLTRGRQDRKVTASLRGSDGKVRWRLGGRAADSFVRVMAGDEVMVCEQPRKSEVRESAANLCRAQVQAVSGGGGRDSWFVWPLQECLPAPGERFVFITRTAVRVESREGQDRLLFPPWMSGIEIEPLGRAALLPGNRALVMEGPTRARELDLRTGKGTTRRYGLRRAKDGEVPADCLPLRDCSLLVVDPNTGDVSRRTVGGGALWKARVPGACKGLGAWFNGSTFVYCGGRGRRRVREFDANGRPVANWPTEEAPDQICFPLLRLGIDSPPATVSKG